MAKADSTQQPQAATPPRDLEESREYMIQAWSRTCSLYSQYFTALANANTPASFAQANVDLFSNGVEAIGKGIAAFQQVATPSVFLKGSGKDRT